MVNPMKAFDIGDTAFSALWAALGIFVWQYGNFWLAIPYFMVSYSYIKEIRYRRKIEELRAENFRLFTYLVNTEGTHER